MTDPALQGIAERVRRGVARAGGVRVVGVDGPSGSGKSTVATALAAALECPVVQLDELIPGWDGLAEGPRIVAADVLAPLGQDRPSGYRRYDWVAGEYAEWHPIALTPYLVIEGVGAGARLVAPYLTLLVWVEAPQELRFARGIERDGETYRPHWERWARQEDAHYAAEGTRERADVRLDGAC